MINLLADDKKREIRSGRVNVILVRYLSWVIAAGAVLAGIVLAALIVLNVSRQEAKTRADSSQLQVAQYSASERQAATFRQDLATAKQILDKEVAYSTALLKIAASLPKGVYIQNIDLDATKLGTKTSLSFRGVSQDAILQLKTKLEQDTELYGDVHFESIELAGEGPHPVNASVSLVINKGVLQ